MGPQPQVDAVGRAQVGGVGDESRGLLDDAIEKLLVGAGLGAVDSAVGGVDEHEVDVAGVVELAPAQLAQRDCGDRGGATVGPAGDAPLPMHVGHRRRQGQIDDAVGDVRDLR